MTTNRILHFVLKPTLWGGCVVLHENRKIRMTKKVLRDSLIELLYTKDISEVTVTELCKKADVNRSTFYSHYETLTQVLDDIEGDFLSHIPFYDPLTIAITTEQYFYQFISYIEKNPKRFIILLNNRRVLPTICDRAIDLIPKTLPKEEYLYQEYSTYCFVFGTFPMIAKYLEADDRISTKEFSNLLLKMIKRNTAPF